MTDMISGGRLLQIASRSCAVEINSIISVKTGYSHNYIFIYMNILFCTLYEAIISVGSGGQHYD